MIYTSVFRLDANKKELFESYSDSFPYICLDVSLDYLIGRSWHWHPAFEVDYILEGCMDLQTAERTIHLKKGDAVFINSNVMHEAHASQSGKDCRIYAHLFSNTFLSGMYGSLFDQEFLYPISSSQALTALPIYPDRRSGARMIHYLLKAVEYNREEAFGYQFEIRAALCRFWCLLLEDTAEMRADKNVYNLRYLEDSERIKKMVEYIHENYHNSITVQNIASAANVSVRECGRCFQRCLKQSPAVFLMNFRITTAARFLIHTSLNIMEISEACGFSSPSYFTKVFREIHHCTPGEYRRRNRESGN